jgi:hypothetical protein
MVAIFIVVTTTKVWRRPKQTLSWLTSSLPLPRCLGLNSVAGNTRSAHSSPSLCVTYLTLQIERADEFEYLDPVDGSVSSHQGVRVLLVGGSRVVFRLSGTAGSGATIRIYLEKYENDPSKLFEPVAEALGDMVEIALAVSNLVALTGMTAPTVIT